MVRYYDNYYYWQRKASVTEVTYDQYNEVKYTSATTTYTYDNAQHHQPTLVTKTLADGQVLKEYTSYPGDYNQYASFVLTAMAGRLRMMTQIVENFSTMQRPGGVENVISGTFVHYDITGPSNQLAVPIQVDKLQLAAPLAFTSFQRSIPRAYPDTNYQPYQYINYEPASGNIASLRKADDVLTSYQWGYTGQLAVATYRNADRTPPLPNDLSKGNEASSTGFETGVANAGTDPDEDYWGMTAASGQNFVSSTAHTGNYSWHLGAVTNGFNYGPGRTFSPQRQQLRYRLSAWVKTDAGFGANDGRLVLSINRQNGSQVQGVADCYQATSFSDTGGKWQYVEVILDLNAAHTSLGVSPTAEQLQVVAYIYNAGGAACLVDDMRFQPVEAAATTYTYDAQSRQPTSISDTRSYPTYYEYDAQQRLLVVKDHRMGIQKALEYHYQQH